LILFVNKKAYIKDILSPSEYGPEEKGYAFSRIQKRQAAASAPGDE